MGNLISLFLGSMLPTEPETSNPCKITFLEHSCSTQVQQTPLPMPVLGSTPLLGQKRFHLGHKVPDEYCFQSQAEKVLRRKQFLPFSKKRYLASYSRPETEQVQPLWGLLPATAVPQQLWNPAGAFGEYCKCTFQSTHITGVPVSLPAIYS